MKVALVYDRINKWGGAERVLLALHEIWPEAPLFTAVYDPKGAAWAKVFPRVIPSFLQYFPLARTHHEFYPWLTPLAFETFNFDDFDVVISVTSAEAKSIITKPETLHICYSLTPTRYLWSGYDQYQETPGWGVGDSLARLTLKALGPTLRRWDLLAATRPDYYLAISERVKERVQRYYKREVAAVIYPPVDLNKFKVKSEKLKVKDSYFLTVSRLVGHKRVDIIIDTFNDLGWPLVVIGDGRARSELEYRAKSNITFLGANLTDQDLVSYYQNCRALIVTAEEDFGLVAVEAQACGKPVVAFGQSGIAEVITQGKTGLLFKRQDKEALSAALLRFKRMNFTAEACRKSSERFSKDTFTRQMEKTVISLWQRYQHEQEVKR
ncbi:MAG: glycosyltransferase [Patescibacteria group bacterium]